MNRRDFFKSAALALAGLSAAAPAALTDTRAAATLPAGANTVAWSLEQLQDVAISRDIYGWEETPGSVAVYNVHYLLRKMTLQSDQLSPLPRGDVVKVFQLAFDQWAGPPVKVGTNYQPVSEIKRKQNRAARSGFLLCSYDAELKSRHKETMKIVVILPPAGDGQRSGVSRSFQPPPPEGISRHGDTIYKRPRRIAF